MNKKVLISIILTLVLLLGVVVAVYLLRSSQDPRSSASVPGGASTISMTPTSATLAPGEPTQVSVVFNTGGVLISGIAAELDYTYSEATEPVDVTNIAISSALLASGDWQCPVTEFSASGGTASVKISCFNTTTTGYSSEVDVVLATFDLVAGQTVPVINPIVMSFEPTSSIIISKGVGDDVLLIPESTGTYSVRSAIGGGGGSETLPTSTPAAATASASPATPTPVPTATATATPVATLPDAGIGSPTLMGIGAGAVLIFGALLLAI